MFRRDEPAFNVAFDEDSYERLLDGSTFVFTLNTTCENPYTPGGTGCVWAYQFDPPLKTPDGFTDISFAVLDLGRWEDAIRPNLIFPIDGPAEENCFRPDYMDWFAEWMTIHAAPSTTETPCADWDSIELQGIVDTDFYASISAP